VPARDLSHVRRWVVTGSPLSPETRSRFAVTVPDAAIWQYYGATESPHMTLLRPDEGQHRRGSVGKPFSEVRLRICDDLGQAVATGKDGEIWARSPWMLDSYHDNLSSTAEALRDGWYRPGDLGRFHAEGYLFVTGRKRDVIISGGLNIYPAEVESVLRSHPRVVEAAVVGIPDNYWGGERVAVIVRSAFVEPDELLGHCRAHLASYKKPARVMFVAAMPRNHMGKVDKNALTQLAEGQVG
jgi:acyl-CoA synthetase (AMP-forming)/AMP-acid ligase II